MKTFCYEYPRPALTVDATVFSFIDNNLNVLLIKRALEPFKDFFALPGGFLNENEFAEEAVARELFEETGVQGLPLVQFYTVSTPNRDPRGWTISIVFMGLTVADKIELKSGDDAKDAAWFPINNLPDLAFDHKNIIQKAVHHLKTKSRFIFIADQILNENFSMKEFTSLGIQLDINEHDVHKRFERFYKLGLIKNSLIEGHLCFDHQKLRAIK